MNQIEASRILTSDFDPPVPDGLALKPFQRASVEYLWKLLNRCQNGALLADEMGCGKTISTIAFINQWRRRGLGKILIICPAFLKLNWRRELRQWLTDPASIEVVNGRSDYRSGDITIINYQIVIHHKEALDAEGFDLIICDESQALKNPKAKVTRAVLGVGKETKEARIPRKFLLFLSGTPMLNTPADLWTTVRAMCMGMDNRQLFTNEWTFKNRFCFGGFGYGGKRDFRGAQNLDELQLYMRGTFMRRVLKRQVLKDLPPKIRQVIPVTPLKEMNYELDREKKTFKLGKRTIQDLKERARAARKAKNHAELKTVLRDIRFNEKELFGQMADMRKQAAMAVLPFAIDMLKDALDADPDEKIVVFAHHHEVLLGLEEGLRKYRPALVYGETPMGERDTLVRRFQENEKCRVFIGGIRAAGVGLTLTRAGRAVFVESDWTPAAVNQAEDRIHRIGQDRGVLIQHIVLEDSIAAKIIKTCVRKQDIMDESLDNEKKKAERAKAEVTVPGSKVTKSLGEFIHDLLRRLASKNEEKGEGFNRSDYWLGNQLAEEGYLMPDDAEIGRRILLKYKRQLTAEEFKLLAQ